MATVPVPVAEIMSDPDLSLSSSPFSPGNMVIKRASYPAGETPEHLRQFSIDAGECAGETGTSIVDGKPIPNTAACVKENRER